ncbi:MAG: DUF456 domain-containing protein [Candidatus Desulforudis sp.]|nr:DUF456 domain-containing protein [Desulforudis sp.]
MATLALLVALLFFLAGFAGILLPVLPGVILIWLGMLVYGLMTGFDSLSFAFFVGQGVAVALTILVDYAATVWGVHRFGGSRIAVWGGIAGLLLGVIVLGPFGIILGPFIGAFAAELLVRGSVDQALRVGLGTLIGFLGSTATKLVIAGAMLLWFFIAIA